MPHRYCHIFAVFFLLVLASHARAGYDHYWRWTQKPDEAKLKACVAEMRKILVARQLIAGEGRPPATQTGRVRAIIGEDLLTIVESGSDAEEPFVFPGRTGPNICTVDSPAYNEVVTACLIVARDHFTDQELRIQSEGTWPDAWAAGAACYREALGRTAKNPLSQREPADRDETGIAIDDDPPKRGFDQQQMLWGIASIVLIGAVIYFFWTRSGTARTAAAWHFTIKVSGGKATFSGRIPTKYEWTLSRFFENDVPTNASYKVMGRWGRNGRLTVKVQGAKECEQQIRNYVMLVLKGVGAPVE